VNNVNKDECLECGGKGHTKQEKQKFAQGNQKCGSSNYNNYRSNNRGTNRGTNRGGIQKNNGQWHQKDNNSKFKNNLEESHSDGDTKNVPLGAQFQK